MRCPSCGAQHHGNDVTCLICGSLLAISPEELERVERYRISANTEMLCVVFADISGFSGISDRSLSMSQRILAIHTTLTNAVFERERGGEIVNTAGDGLLAVFSNPATAVERALELHAAIHHYHQGLITDGYLADALRSARLPLHPSVDDEEFKVHIGLHVGLVTRGGRTSRDVFGHNVNVACRLCDLGGFGQTFMSEAVYDNARLILGAREDLEWKTWKEQTIRGISTLMDVVGVVQQPYHTLTPPRGMKPVKPVGPPIYKRKSVLIPLAIVMLLLFGVWGWQQWRTRITAPAATTAAVDAPNDEIEAPTGEGDLPPLVAETPDETTPDAHAPAPPELTAEQANVTGSATNITPTATTTTDGGPGVLPPPDAGPPPADAADVTHFTAERMKSAATISLESGTEKLSASLLASRGKEGMLLAVGLSGTVPDGAQLALLIDGDCDNRLQTQSVAPIIDLMLRVGARVNEAAPVTFYAMSDGKPGTELVAPKGLDARRMTGQSGDIWLFRLPYSQLALSGRKYAQFRLEYWPNGADKPSVLYPATGAKLRRLEIPQSQ